MWSGKNFGCGMWLFPIMMMLFAVSRIFGRGGGFKPPWSQGSDRHHGNSPALETALDILKNRYVRGETAKAEFEQMKKDL